MPQRLAEDSFVCILRATAVYRTYVAWETGLNWRERERFWGTTEETVGELRAREAQGYARPRQEGAFSALARDLIGAEQRPALLFASARDSAITASRFARDGRVLVWQKVYIGDKKNERRSSRWP